MPIDASQSWIFAALSELVYRRDETDQALNIADIIAPNAYKTPWYDQGADELLEPLASVGFQYNESVDGPKTIYHPNGMTAFVVQVGAAPDEKFVVVFRGTDSDGMFRHIESSIRTELYEEIRSSFTGTNEPIVNNGESADGGDWVSNLRMGLC